MVILQQGCEPIPGYVLAEKLGEGSFGVVWAADGPGDTRVALKFLDLHQAGGAKEFESISAIKNVRHPNLLPITGYWLLDRTGKPIRDGRTNRFRMTPCEPATLVIAMVVGEKSLDDVLQDYRSRGQSGIPLVELLDYVEDAARGLDFLNAPRHDLGDGRRVSIAHRDIKPDNILLVGDAAVLCDFGVARPCYADSIRSTGMIGSPAFISPESISGHGSVASDQYSLALTYYYLRTGDHSVQAINQATAIHCHVSGELDFSKVGVDEQKVLERATSLDASARFDSCRQMVRALHQAVAQSSAARSMDPAFPIANPDAIATAIDPRFQSTTAAEGNELAALSPLPGSHVARTGSWRKRKTGKGRRFRRLVASTVMIALAALSIQFVSRGPQVQGQPHAIAKLPISMEHPPVDASPRASMADDESETDELRLADDSVADDSVAVSTVPVINEHPEVTPQPPTPAIVDPAAEQNTDRDPAVLQVVTHTTAVSDDVTTDTAPETIVASVPETVAPATQADPADASDRTIVAYQKLGGTFTDDRSELDLSGTKVTNADLSRLRSLPSLISLSLENTAIDDEGLATIVELQPNLEKLFLSHTKVTNSGLTCLGRLGDLVCLDLAGCKITDAGLVHLHSLEGLKAVGLKSTRVSRSGMERLSEALSHRAVIQGPQFSLLGGKRFDVMH
ncbi:protein kinase domain-containing protein [Planctomycetes bacterium TBK1r]|uniref:Serine/threonine-protein kinase D n=1 Tax=Stieleria magnilauensis TaxID=2527963 RepID=A0ABX5XW20_9BACT|nr:Serine/threonine-protein kinase D [Planctomycetes bacterium TBK1r]